MDFSRRSRSTSCRVLISRESSTLEIGEHFVRVIISENYGIDADSVELFWWVTSKGQNDAIISGSTPLTLEGSETTGLRLSFTGMIDLSGMDTEFLGASCIENEIRRQGYRRKSV